MQNHLPKLSVFAWFGQLGLWWQNLSPNWNNKFIKSDFLHKINIVFCVIYIYTHSLWHGPYAAECNGHTSMHKYIVSSGPWMTDLKTAVYLLQHLLRRRCLWTNNSYLQQLCWNNNNKNPNTYNRNILNASTYHCKYGRMRALFIACMLLVLTGNLSYNDNNTLG